MRVDLTIIALLLGVCCVAQADDVAYVLPERPARQVEPKVAIVDGALPGMMELGLPRGTTRLDLLNGKGRLTQRYDAHELTTLDLGSLRAGTWTLRAHTPQGLVVRRIMILENGSLWALDNPARGQRMIRRPLD